MGSAAPPPKVVGTNFSCFSFPWKKKKNKSSDLPDRVCPSPPLPPPPPPPQKGNPNGGGQINRLPNNAPPPPPPPDIVGKIPSERSPPHSPPPPVIAGSAGSSSNHSGSEPPLPLPSPGPPLWLSPGPLLRFSNFMFGLEELSFGCVHKGVLPDGKEVAVKQLNKVGWWQGEKEFLAEEGEWSIRYKIAVGAAKGLGYLHEDCDPRIHHGDIKAANTLLDYNFEPKVGDFGLAKGAPDTHPMGTLGYLAPEYVSRGKVSRRTDIFSFGVMLLEIITGRQPVNSSSSHEDVNLVNWVLPLLKIAFAERKYDDLVDPNLQNDYNRVQMATMVACASACVLHDEILRPNMLTIAHTLEDKMSRLSLENS